MSNSIFDGSNWGKHPDADDPEEIQGKETTAAEATEKPDADGDELKGLLDFLAQMKGVIDSESDDDEEDEDDDDDDLGDDDDLVDEDGGMDANDYHNKAVDFARRGKNKMATKICLDGLKHFPLNVDLLSDTIKYCSEAGDLRTAAKHYAILKQSVPFPRWNWRAYTFAFDYLSEADPIANEAECRTIIANYKKYLPYEEKACMAESELEMALGNAERSMSVLEEAIATHENASQCALRLADMQLDRGLYAQVIVTATYGIAASAETQPSINVPYLYYIRALAKDHILHKKECNHEPIDRAEVEALSKEYEMLLSEFPELMRHSHTIRMRSKMLKFVEVS